MQSTQRCKHSYDGINLICPFGCHGQQSKPLEEVTHIPGLRRKVWFSDYRIPQTINMVGKVVGRLTIKAHLKAGYFECECVCKEKVIRRGTDLRKSLKDKINSACNKCLRNKQNGNSIHDK